MSTWRSALRIGTGRRATAAATSAARPIGGGCLGMDVQPQHLARLLGAVPGISRTVPATCLGA
jgi:hypothetical protein